MTMSRSGRGSGSSRPRAGEKWRVVVEARVWDGTSWRSVKSTPECPSLAAAAKYVMRLFPTEARPFSNQTILDAGGALASQATVTVSEKADWTREWVIRRQ
jgi:hypothetical protein